MNSKKTFPFYMQYDVMDCGPSCLRMIAEYYGKTYSMQCLREKCYVSKEGVSLLGLRSAADSLGMESKCVIVSFEYLLSEAKLPCIVHWDKDHFVVIYKISKKKIFIADPACGKVKYGKLSFLSHWSIRNDEGYALFLSPSEAFYERKEECDSSRGFLKLLAHLKPYRSLLFQLLLAMLLGSLIQLVFPFLTQIIVDKGIGEKNFDVLQIIVSGQMLLIISRMCVNYIRGWILFYISIPINISLVYEFIKKLTKLPLSYFDIKIIGDTLQRISDHQRIEVFLTSTSLNIALTAANVIVFGSVLFVYSIKIFILFFLFTLLYMFWIKIFLSKRREMDFIKFKKTAKNQSALIQLINGMQEIRLNNGEKRKIGDWVGIQKELYDIGKKSLALNQKQHAGCFMIQEVQNILITYLAACFVIDGSMSFGMMLAVQFIIGQMNGPVEQMLNFAAAAQDAKISSERIQEIYSILDEEKEEEKILRIPSDADIELKNICFQYNGPYSEMVLKNVSFVIENKKITAIVGQSGCGKTTLLKLLSGMYRPLSGEILIGKTLLNELSLASWRDQCGFVMQDGYIFSDSIVDNISMKEKEVNEAMLSESLHIANMIEFISSLPSGLKTKIGADGQGLSQGQKQRVLIARSIYKNPEFIFFDEATNSLDAKNEKNIMQNLREYFQNKTVVIIAHRLSTVKNADKIIVIEKGEVIEKGRHNDLIEKKGLYYNLVKNQLELES